MIKKHKSLMFFIFVLLGIMINLQFRSILDNPSSAVSAKDLAASLETEKAKGRELLDRLNNLEAEEAQLLKNIGKGRNDPEINELIQERDYEYFRAGLTAVSGNGITVTLQDAEEPGSMDIRDYIIHDSDINDILNELRINGAEAISINGERIIGTSKLVCAGPTIFLNRSRYPPPYVIKAIGDPDILYEAIDKLPAVAIARIYGIRIDVAIENDMVIEKYNPYQKIDQLLNGLEVVTQ